MAEFLSPDVFDDEVQGKNGQIAADSTSTFALAGYSPRGPEGKAFIHNSFKEFTDRFGGFSSKSLNCYAVVDTGPLTRSSSPSTLILNA